MIDLQGAVFSYDSTRELAYAAILIVAGLGHPLYRWKRATSAPESTAARRTCLWRLFLLVLLIPPVVWAMSEGRFGATIRQRHERLIGTSIGGRYLGGIDLEADSLILMKATHYGRPTLTLQGARHGERLRIDGFRKQDGTCLDEALLRVRAIPFRE